MQLKSNKTNNYFIGSTFVFRVFDDLTKKIDKHKDTILKQMQEMDLKVQEVLSIKHVDMPDMRDRFSINA